MIMRAIEIVSDQRETTILIWKKRLMRQLLGKSQAGVPITAYKY